MALQTLVVAAFVLYAVAYLGRYVYRMMKGKNMGCGCGAGGECPKSRTADSKRQRATD
ncbi:MAG: FeoB-associated Cys-rich membrane protein [Candidatus Hydrogenedentes bacterium]|nr:FeoB-associated Cys-rich membrane protein [Candidatus Hydrogenedentota bacterium]